MKKILLIIFIHFLVIQMICASNSQIFVLVHGAWHGNWTFFRLQSRLENAGNTVININLPGHGLDKTPAGNVTLADYSNAIVQVLDTLNEQVVLVGHSMGGIAISMAAEARPNKIDKLVYLAAFMPKNGESMLDLALQDSLSQIGPSLIFDFPNNVVDLRREKIGDIFYDSYTAPYVYLSEMLLTPNPLQPIVTPLTLTVENYGSVRRFYIATNLDQAITPDFQEYMYTEQPCEEVFYINSSHSPFFSHPTRLKKILTRIANDSILNAPAIPIEHKQKMKNIDGFTFLNFISNSS
ncbi:MAG: alpha/beta fold hydrolase [Bacteroidales bacterium]|nr:alpha/beta fold hydrolase [Bacteroidales bacterium]